MRCLNAPAWVHRQYAAGTSRLREPAGSPPPIHSTASALPPAPQFSSTICAPETALSRSRRNPRRPTTADTLRAPPRRTAPLTPPYPPRDELQNRPCPAVSMATENCTLRATENCTLREKGTDQIRAEIHGERPSVSYRAGSSRAHGECLDALRSRQHAWRQPRPSQAPGPVPASGARTAVRMPQASEHGPRTRRRGQ